MLNPQELQKQNTRTHLLPLDTLEDIPIKTYLYDESGERSGRHFNTQVLTKYLYNEGAQEINKNKDLINIYYALPLHNGKNGSLYSTNEPQGIFAIYVALEKLEPKIILHAYKKLGKEMSKITNCIGIKLPNGTQFGFESALYSIVHFYITKFNPNRFDNSTVTKISSMRDIELILLRFIMFHGENDTSITNSFLDKGKQKKLCNLTNKHIPVITDPKNAIKPPEPSNIVPLKFFKKPTDDIIISSEEVSQSSAHCSIM